MGCLTLKVTPVEGAILKVTPTKAAAMKVTPEEGAALKVTPVQGASLSIGEVCSVSPGTIVVLAGSDGPLRTSDGGYFLLNPALNPPEES